MTQVFEFDAFTIHVGHEQALVDFFVSMRARPVRARTTPRSALREAKIKGSSDERTRLTLQQ